MTSIGFNHATSRSIRPAAVAGRFYPEDALALRTTVEKLLGDTNKTVSGGKAPKAIIAPHAGYIFSGPIAAAAFARFLPDRDQIRRIVLIGPAHYVRVPGFAAPEWSAFATPLGVVPVDPGMVAGLRSSRQVLFSNQPHAQEHCLEVELPFLQVVLDQFNVVPLLVGSADTEEVATVLDHLWGGPETRIVVSSDLSHFHDYQTARRLDAETARTIVGLEPEALGEDAACGRIPINGLLEVARKRGLTPRMLDLRNSGDTAGSRQEVVGYGAFEFG